MNSSSRGLELQSPRTLLCSGHQTQVQAELTQSEVDPWAAKVTGQSHTRLEGHPEVSEARRILASFLSEPILKVH